MLCERCMKKEAKVHIVKIVNGSKKDQWLCEECAKQMSEEAFMMLGSNGSNIIKKDDKNISDVLGMFFEALDNTPKQDRKKEAKIDIVCKNCGTKFSKYKKTGRLGCSKCYENFAELLKPDIKRYHKETIHVGKKALRASMKQLGVKQIEELKKQLSKLVADEQFEEAAIIRDKIKALEEINLREAGKCGRFD